MTTPDRAARGEPTARHHVIGVLACSTHELPARVCAMLAQRQADLTGLQMSKTRDGCWWWIHVGVRVASATELRILIDRLHRLIDVVDVAEIPAQDPLPCQCVVVRLRPTPQDRSDIADLARKYGADTFDGDGHEVRLQLCADPPCCQLFVSSLDRFGVLEVAPGAGSDADRSAPGGRHWEPHPTYDSPDHTVTHSVR